MTQQSAPYHKHKQTSRPSPIIKQQLDEDDLMATPYETFSDSQWEDEEEEPQPTQEKRSQTTSSPRPSPRKRTKAMGQSQPHSRRKTRPISPKPVPTTPKANLPPIISKEEILHGALQTAVSSLRFMWGITGNMFNLAYWPLSLLSAILFLALVVLWTSSTIRAAFSPLCFVPGISSSMWCHPINSTRMKETQWVDFPKLMEVQGSTFENMMMESIGAPTLSLDIKNAEMATKDLVVVLRHSDLKAKDSLVSTLNVILADAKKTGEGLGKLFSKVGGAVDRIMSTNDWAINTIESARASEPTPWSMGAVVPWMKPKKTLDEVVAKTFDDSMYVLSREMERLILEASTNLQNLNNLEEHLMSLHEIVHLEDSSVSTAKNELLAELWTHLGLNKKKMRNFDKNLNILKGVRMYREEAKSRVIALLHMLKTMQNDMEEMRERVAAPDLLGSSIPIEVHLKSIKIGLERMQEGRIKSQHLEEERRRNFMLAQGFEG